jgi:hypothetical protein
VSKAEKYTVDKIILISSTAVYSDLSGEVNEETPLDYSSDKVATIDAAEQAVIAFKGKSVVLSCWFNRT